MDKKSIRLLFIFLFQSTFSFSQDVTNQLWTSGFLYHTLRDKLKVLTEMSYRTVLNQDDRWSRYQNQFDFRYSILKNLDVHAGSFFIYTSHNEEFKDLDAFEVRPFAGVKYHFTRDKRVNVRDFFRYEQRFFKYSNTGENEVFTRLRNRVEIVASINRPNLNQDKLLYFNMDGEIFFNASRYPQERFINFFQSRLGPGYRFNYHWRAELFFVFQLTKDKSTALFNKTSNIAFVRFLYYTSKKQK